MKSTTLILSLIAYAATVSCGKVFLTINGDANPDHIISGDTKSNIILTYKSDSMFGRLKPAHQNLKLYALCFGSQTDYPEQIPLAARYDRKSYTLSYNGIVPCSNEDQFIKYCAINPSANNGAVKINYSQCSSSVPIIPGPESPGGRQMRAGNNKALSQADIPANSDSSEGSLFGDGFTDSQREAFDQEMRRSYWS